MERMGLECLTSKVFKSDAEGKWIRRRPYVSWVHSKMCAVRSLTKHAFDVKQ